MNKKSWGLLIIGLFVVSATIIFNHYFNISDFYNGVLKGIGIGMIVIGLVATLRRQPRKTTGS